MESKNLAPLDLIQILDRVYPIGTPYFNELDPRNPNIILGFGTWAARTGFMAGKAASGTFANLGATGGTETVTLTAAQSGLPAHNHPLGVNLVTGGTNAGAVGSWGTAYTGTDSNMIKNNTAANAASAHSNLPPFTVYAWWVRVS